MWFVKSSLYGWNVIENSWCTIAVCKHILMAQIALNCLEFHFLIKSPCLACRKLVLSLMKCALSIRGRMGSFQC